MKCTSYRVIDDRTRKRIGLLKRKFYPRRYVSQRIEYSYGTSRLIFFDSYFCNHIRLAAFGGNNTFE